MVMRVWMIMWSLMRIGITVVMIRILMLMRFESVEGWMGRIDFGRSACVTP